MCCATKCFLMTSWKPEECTGQWHIRTLIPSAKDEQSENPPPMDVRYKWEEGYIKGKGQAPGVVTWWLEL